MAELDPASGTSRYSAVTLEHFQHPRNVGRLPDADAVGSVEDAATETSIALAVKLAGGRVAVARFRTLGCSACVAASSIATELLSGRTAAEARRLDGDALDAALGGLPADKRYCADLVAQAVQRLADALDARGPVAAGG